MKRLKKKLDFFVILIYNHYRKSEKSLSCLFLNDLDVVMKRDYDPIKISRFSNPDRIYDIWNQYANAMAKRRPDSVLPIERFEYYIMNYAGMFKYKDSYIFGQKINDFFIPSHFAPKSMKEGVEMLKDLKKYDNIIFVVTEDLASMLKKLGYKQLPHTVKKNFNDVLTDKKILISSFKHIQRLAKLMLTYLMGNDIQPMNIDLEEHGVREYEPPTVWDKQTTRKVRTIRIQECQKNRSANNRKFE